MKIIRTGSKAPGTWTKQFKCRECKSTLEVGESDLHVENHAVFYGGETWEPEVCFTCLVCHSSNTVTDNIPTGIQNKLIDEASKKHRG